MRTMGRIAACMMSVALFSACVAPLKEPSARHDQVVAFARLYGVVRYFYPGDAAQQIDWNRFAIAGIGDVQHAHDRDALQKTLRTWFAPLGPGIDIVADAEPFPPALKQSPGDSLVAWRYQGFPGNSTTYQALRTSRTGPSFIGLGSSVNAMPLRGKAIRLRGELRAFNASGTKGLGMLLRVDRLPKPPGFFENTAPHQIHDLAWHDYEITTTVGADATAVVFGVIQDLSPGEDPVTGLRHLALDVSDGHGHWTPAGIPDLRSANKIAPPWSAFGVNRPTVTAWQTQGADGYLTLRPGAVTQQPVAGNVVEFELGDGLKARVALTLSDAQARLSPDRAADLSALKARLVSPSAPKANLVTQNEADVVVAWNALRHFFPYWDDVHLNWDDALPVALADADQADSRAAQRHVLQRLQAPLDDAHATVYDPAGGKRGALPILLAPVEHRWVVVATAVPDQARVGDVVTSLDGVPMPKAANDEEALYSGQPSSRGWKAMETMAYGPLGQTHSFGLQHADGSGTTQTFTYADKPLPTRKRPEPLSEIAPGVWYVDISRIDQTMFNAKLETLAHAHAVIYDLRVYPKDFRMSVALPAYLLDHAENAKWMHVPIYVAPFGKPDSYKDVGWDIRPASPHFNSRAIFIADGDTISQGESITGYVQDEKLGTIVGSTTRGIDGDITRVEVPSGMHVIFTGMKVTHHDGVSRYLGLGTPADVVVQPTIGGVRAGRDEELDAALKLAK